MITYLVEIPVRLTPFTGRGVTKPEHVMESHIQFSIEADDEHDAVDKLQRVFDFLANAPIRPV